MRTTRTCCCLSLLLASLALCRSGPVWAIDPPHEQDCANCHSPHHAAGAALTVAAGNANLCMTCHNPVGVAWPLPFSDSLQAVAGTRGTSHRWDSGVAGHVEADPANTSGGTVESGGAFTGRYSKTYTIAITAPGEVGTARFSWTATTPGGGSAADVQTGTGVALDEGVTVSFANAAAGPSFAVNDTWRLAVTTGLSQPASARLRLIDGKVSCSTCHNQHSQQGTPFDPNSPAYGGRGTGAGRHFQRIDNDTAQMCRDCHRERDVADSSEGSHPIGMGIPSDPAYMVPANLPLEVAEGKVECQTCHSTHFASSGDANGGLGDGYLLNASLSALCNECHLGGGDAASNPHLDPNAGALWPGGRFGSTFPAQPAERRGACTNCHWPHGWPSDAEPSSDYPTLLVDRPDRLCLNCHDDKDEGHTHGQGCLAACHGDHSKGFAHGGGGSGACEDCHGHDDGWNGGSYYGTTASHSTHTDNDTDDQRGPTLACDACHDPQSIPDFRSGIDSDGDGRIELAETDVCDACHSPGGDFDGVSDAALGARTNWSAGVYQDDGTLKSGKEQWCATCHDKSPSIIDGIAAPNVVGDESAAYTYGTGYGFYKTGHGLPPTSPYPASGYSSYGAGAGCDACHASPMRHIDGVARTYERTASVGADNDYQHGYRLKSVNGELPMSVPRMDTCFDEGVIPDDFRLCFSCHDSAPFTDPDSVLTNYRHFRSGESFNAHYYHLEVKGQCGPGPMWSSDWSFSGWDSRASCTTCHDVHGSTQLSMVRDGRLIGRSRGLELVYYKPGVSYVCGGPAAHDPTPEDTKLSESTGTVWNAGALSNEGFCNTCHGSCGFDARYDRIPFDVTPPLMSVVYGGIGSSVLTVKFLESVYTDTGASGALEAGDFSLADLDDNRTITGAVHTAGDRSALLIISAPLDGADDIAVDAVAAATESSIYDASGNAMLTEPVVISADPQAPAAAGMDPEPGAIGVSPDRDLSLTLSDAESGIDWTSFSIHLEGDKGYSRTYTGADTAVVTKTGTAESYSVSVAPDTNFGSLELITVTVNVSDFSGNPLAAPAWSFTSAAGGTPQTLTLHPSGLNSQTGGWSTTPTNTWATSLDSNDGNSSYAALCCTSPDYNFYVDMDDPVGIDGAAIQNVTFHVYARFATYPSGGASTGTLNIGYRTGTNTVWRGNFTTSSAGGSYNLVSSTTYTTDSDGGALDLNDINNLRIAVRRVTSGSVQLRATEVYAEVTYIP